MASVEQLLREIQSESLQRLLVSVQQDIKPPVLISITAFDAYLSESSADLHSRSSSRSSLNPGDVIHVQGRSGSGKTHLLYFLLATCTMPPHYLSCPVGGWNKAAFVFDMDGTFSMPRFHQLLIDRLKKSLPSMSVTSIGEKCLNLLHVFRPASSEQLVVTLAHLPKYHSVHFPDAELGMVAIHSVDAFYWLDRFKADQLRASSSSNKNAVSHNLSSKLDDIRRTYGVITILTQWGLPPSQSSTFDISSGTLNACPPASTNAQPSSIPPRIVDIPLTYQLSLKAASMDSLDITDNCRRRDVAVHVQTVGRPDTTTFSFGITDLGLDFK